ncbi:glycosyl transferase, partial [Mediterraneibacter gnavus]
KSSVFSLLSRHYLNSIYFGNGYNSVAEACRGYFGKEPMEMNFDECTMLAGIPNAPSAYNPLVNPDLAYQRQQQVIRKMEKAGFLNK